MNSGDHNIDKLFKDAFDNQEHDISAAYWQDAQLMLNAEKVTPIFTKSYLMIGILSIAISSILFFADSTPKSFVTSKRITNVSTQNISELIPQTTHLKGNNQEPVSINSKKSKRKSVNTAGTINKNSLPHSSNTISNIHHTSKITSEKENTVRAEAVSETNNQSQPIQKEHLASRSDQNSTSELYEDESTQSSNSITSYASIQNNVLGSKTLMSSNSHEISDPHKKPVITSIPSSKVSPVFSSNEILIGSITPKNLNWKQSNFSLLNISSLERKDLKPIHQPLTLRMSVGNLWSESLNKSTTNVQTYAQNRNLEISAEYLFKANWGIQLGISYNAIQEDQAHRGLGLIDNSYWNDIDKSYWDFQQKQITVQDSTWWLGGWWQYPPRQDSITDSTYISKYDRIHVTKYDTTDKDFKSKQTIKLIEIPVLLTYNFNKERWNFQIASGMSFGFYSNSNGQIIRPGDPVNLESSSKSLFNSIQYNYLLQTELGYSLSDHWQINARPQLKMNLNSIYNVSSGFQHKYMFYGANIGVAYRF
jgi:hypothetical protein